MKLSDKFIFGKFKGQTLQYVMANKGSYVGWCIENIKGFKIEPESLHDDFMNEYNKYKSNGYKGTIIDRRNHGYLPLGVKEMEENLISRLNETILGDLT